MTPQDYFKLGAEAMRTEICVRLMTGSNPNGVIIAHMILTMSLPKFQLPETQTM